MRAQTNHRFCRCGRSTGSPATDGVSYDASHFLPRRSPGSDFCCHGHKLAMIPLRGSTSSFTAFSFFAVSVSARTAMYRTYSASTAQKTTATNPIVSYSNQWFAQSRPGITTYSQKDGWVCKLATSFADAIFSLTSISPVSVIITSKTAKGGRSNVHHLIPTSILGGSSTRR